MVQRTHAPLSPEVKITDAMEFGDAGMVTGSITTETMPDVTCKGVLFKAPSANTGIAWLGAPGVTNGGGWPLEPGHETGFWPCRNLSEFGYICDGASDDIHYIYWK